MSYSWDAILQSVAHTLGDATELEVTVDELVAPPDPKLGDLAFGCFRAAKAQGKNPALIAKELVEKIGKGNQNIESATAAGPYVNIVLRAEDVIGRIIKDVELRGKSYGRSDVGKGKQLMLEYANQNTHKELHVGHARVFILGTAVTRLLRDAGWKVITAGYHGDIGAHVAKCLWFLVRHGADRIKQPSPKRRKKNDLELVPLSDEAWKKYVLEHLSIEWVEEFLKMIPKNDHSGKYLGAIYTQATRLLEEQPDLKAEVSEVQQKIENKNPAWNKLWQETRRWSIAEFARLYEWFGMTIDKTYFESEMVEEGQTMVDALLRKDIARVSEGAVIVDLEAEHLGIFVIRKSDGTSLYSTKDLALAFQKFRDFPELERSLVMIDNRQSQYFKQLFRTLQLLGVHQQLEMLGFEFVTLKSGAMSSRQGNIITLQSFGDEVVSYARAETSKRHPDWTDGRIEHTAWALAMGGIKFGMLKQNSDKIITFDLEQALSFDGDTGPYVQYAATRLGSILRKAGYKPDADQHSRDIVGLTGSAEKRLAICAAELPRIAERAAYELRPALIAQWCIDMAAKTNEFYRDVNVLENAELRPARLRLVAAARVVLLRGLDLLGIPVPEEM